MYQWGYTGMKILYLYEIFWIVLSMDVHRKKFLTYLFFLRRINERKRVKIIPSLCEHRIDKIFSQKISQIFSQNYRFS